MEQVDVQALVERVRKSCKYLNYGTITTEQVEFIRDTLLAAEARAQKAEAVVEAARKAENAARIQDMNGNEGDADAIRRDALAALTAYDEPPMGEKHSESLDERGIYGGRSYEPPTEQA